MFFLMFKRCVKRTILEVSRFIGEWVGVERMFSGMGHDRKAGDYKALLALFNHVRAK